MNAPTQLAVIVIVAGACAAATRLVVGTPEKPPVAVCDPSTLQPDEICASDVPENAIWVDARSRSDWEQDKIEGAILWNLDPAENQQDFEVSFMETTGMMKSDAKLIVVYCSSEACGTSRQVAERIRKLELGPEVKILKGGWKALKDSSPRP